MYKVRITKKQHRKPNAKRIEKKTTSGSVAQYVMTKYIVTKKFKNRRIIFLTLP